MDVIQGLLDQGGQLFSKRSGLLSLWQEIADNFYPERADFTNVRNLGADFAANLSTSYPILARRDLGNSFGAMLRPTSKDWFHVRTQDGWEALSVEAKRWLEKATSVQKRAMYDRRSQFSRATKEGDHDFAAFGQCAIQVSLNKDADGMLYRCWHLRDVAWVENADGAIETVYRKWKPTARELSVLFKGKLHHQVTDLLEKTPFEKVEVWHCITAADHSYSDKKYKTKFVSYYLDVAHKHMMEEVGIHQQEYVIPRWQTVSGSQYAYSPATVAALPDARLIQAMTAVLLEAGEKAANPPMIAVQEALRSDISIYAGGITWVDKDYDERLGQVLRPLTIDAKGLPLGFDMAANIRGMIAEAFFLNKITLPQPGSDMTAFEVGQRVQEYIRQAMPLFEPVESEYNAPLCESTFDVMLRMGAFGSVYDMPKELRGVSYQFVFESPLHDATERAKGQRFIEVKSMIAEAMALDPTSAYLVDVKTALREVITAIGGPATWTRSIGEVDDMEKADKQRQATAELLANMQAGADVAKTTREAGVALPDNVASPVLGA